MTTFEFYKGWMPLSFSNSKYIAEWRGAVAHTELCLDLIIIYSQREGAFGPFVLFIFYLSAVGRVE